MIFPIVVVGIVSAASAAIPSASYGSFDICVARAQGVSTEMLLCGKREIKRWDLRLNAVYRELLAGMTAAERVELRQEQRLWLRRHLAETRRLAMDPSNGSAAFLDSQSFELDDLLMRVRVLEKRLGR